MFASPKLRATRPLTAVVATLLIIAGCARVDVSDGIESASTDDITVGLVGDGQETPTPLPTAEPAPVIEVVPTAEPAVVELDFNQEPNSIEIVPGDDNSPLSVATATPAPEVTTDANSGSTTPAATATPQATAAAPRVTETTVTAGGYEPDVPAGNGLNVRESPNGRIVGVILDGEQVTVLGGAQNVSGTVWARVEPIGEADWTTGWVAFKFLKTPGSAGSFPTATPDPDATPTATPDPDATATPTPDPDATATPTPDPDATATPTPDPDATATATPTPDPDATPTPTPENTPTPSPVPGSFVVELGSFVIGGDDVPTALGAPILPEPDINSSAIGFAPIGAVVQVINTQGLFNEGVALVEVRYNDVTGWMSAGYFQFP